VEKQRRGCAAYIYLRGEKSGRERKQVGHGTRKLILYAQCDRKVGRKGSKSSMEQGSY